MKIGWNFLRKSASIFFHFGNIRLTYQIQLFGRQQINSKQDFESKVLL